MSEKWVELKDVPMGRLVVLKGLNDMVRVAGEGRFFPKTHMSLDVGRLGNSGLVLMEYQNDHPCRMATLGDIDDESGPTVDLEKLNIPWSTRTRP